jgi:hypothetical protein
MFKFQKVSGEINVKGLEGGALDITAGKEGGRLSAVGEVDFSDYKYLVFEVTNNNRDQLEMHLEFYNSCNFNINPTLVCVTGSVPDNRVRMYFDFKHLDNQQVFLPRTPGKLKTLIHGSAIRKEDIKGFAISFRDNYKPQNLILHDIYLSSEEPDCSIAEPVKLVDEMGQLSVKDWPGKTKSLKEMTDRMNNLLSSVNLEGFPEEYKYSRFGGFISKRFEATGFFRVDKDEERWWLVDPEGYAFFSVGFDCMGTNSNERINGIEDLYEWLPERGGEFEEAYSEQEGPLGGTGFDFYTANLIRAFGRDWWENWAKISKSHMYNWGLNTIGNWSQQKFVKWAKMPYVYPLADFPSTDKKIFRDFPDVFSEEYKVNSVEYAKQLEVFKDDQYLIGYFMRNEPIWGFAGHINLAREMFRTTEALRTKEALILYLRGKYGNCIKALNKVWNTCFSEFEQINSLTYEQVEGQIDKDLFDFSEVMVEKYISVPAIELKKVDSNHLNLGMRYAWISTELVFQGCQYFDVFSINCYKQEPDKEEVSYITEKTGKPCMIGEYHFGAPDRGLLGAGLRSVATQEDRGIAYRYFTEQAASIKEMLGVHYFTQNDEPTLGRFDGEAWQIGAVDVCQNIYTEFVEGMKEAHKNLYEVASGIKEPYAVKPEEIPRIAY